MFRQKKRKDPAINTLVGKDTRVHGDLEFSGGCLVDGYIKGNVRSVGDEHAMLSVSERGCIEGTVIVPNVMLNGTIKGDVEATQRVELGGNSRVVGNLKYSLIEMAIGAEVNGKLIHASEAERKPAIVDTEPESTPGRDVEKALTVPTPVAKAN